MIGGKRHDLIPSIILLADTMTIPIVEFQVQKSIIFYLETDYENLGHTKMFK